MNLVHYPRIRGVGVKPLKSRLGVAFHLPRHTADHLGHLVHPVFDGIENPELEMIHLLLGMNHEDNLDGNQQNTYFQRNKSGQIMRGEFQDKENQNDEKERDVDPIVPLGERPTADSAQDFFELLALAFELFNFLEKIFSGFIDVPLYVLTHEFHYMESRRRYPRRIVKLCFLQFQEKNIESILHI